jgi:hypothetical protein
MYGAAMSGQVIVLTSSGGQRQRRGTVKLNAVVERIVRVVQSFQINITYHNPKPHDPFKFLMRPDANACCAAAVPDCADDRMVERPLFQRRST